MGYSRHLGKGGFLSWKCKSNDRLHRNLHRNRATPLEGNFEVIGGDCSNDVLKSSSISVSVSIEARDRIKKNDKAGAEWKEFALQPSVTLSRLMSDYQMKSVTNKNNPSDDGEEDYEVKIAELWSRKVGKFRLTWFALKTWQIWYFPRESWGENTMGGDFFIDAAALQCSSGDSGVQWSIHPIRQPADDNFSWGGFTSIGGDVITRGPILRPHWSIGHFIVFRKSYSIFSIW